MKNSQLPANANPLVFVYGTLKRGFGNHSVMKRAGGEFVSCGRTVERYPLVVSGLPYLLDIRGQGYQVEGEISTGFRMPKAGGFWTGWRVTPVFANVVWWPSLATTG